MKLTARPMNSQKDLDAVMEIERNSFHISPWQKTKTFNSYIVRDGKQATVVCDSSGAVVGYYLIKRLDDDIFLTKMAVHSQYRSQGIGQFILADIEKSARAQNAAAVKLHVRASNQSAISLYLKAGYKETRRTLRGYKLGTTGKERTKVAMKLHLTYA